MLGEARKCCFDISLKWDWRLEGYLLLKHLRRGALYLVNKLLKSPLCFPGLLQIRDMFYPHMISHSYLEHIVVKYINSNSVQPANDTEILRH